MTHLRAPLHVRPCLVCGRTAKSSCTNRFIFCSIKCRNTFTGVIEKLNLEEKRAILDKLQCEMCESGH